MTHCLLFDSDGTLVDSEALNTEALADELALHDIVEEKVKLLARYRGWQFSAVVDDLGKRHQVELGEQFEVVFRARASRYFADRLEPVAHMRNALQQLKQTKCVASNAPMSKLKQVLQKTELYSFFDGKVFSAYDISKFKPDPDLFLFAAEQMGYAADKCIVIEDSDVGVQAACAAGMKCVHYQPGGEFAGNSSQGNVLAISSMIDLPAAIATLES